MISPVSPKTPSSTNANRAAIRAINGVASRVTVTPIPTSNRIVRERAASGGLVKATGLCSEISAPISSTTRSGDGLASPRNRYSHLKTARRATKTRTSANMRAANAMAPAVVHIFSKIAAWAGSTDSCATSAPVESKLSPARIQLLGSSGVGPRVNNRSVNFCRRITAIRSSKLSARVNASSALLLVAFNPSISCPSFARSSATSGASVSPSAGTGPSASSCSCTGSISDLAWSARVRACARCSSISVRRESSSSTPSGLTSMAESTAAASASHFVSKDCASASVISSVCAPAGTTPNMQPRSRTAARKCCLIGRIKPWMLSLKTIQWPHQMSRMR